MTLHAFLDQRNDCLLLDVRSEKEFMQGHIPDAVNIALLNDEERHLVGLSYKHQGKDLAVEKGLELVGHKFVDIVRQVKALNPKKQVVVQCWRGGLRSNIVSWILTLAGIKVVVLEDGYKNFRNWALNSFDEPRRLLVLGGQTGSRKTEILQHLAANKQQQVIDLEQLANHRGSSYGHIGMPPQPTNEQFENNLAMAWNSFDSSKPIWIENESRRIGKNSVPTGIYNQIRTAKIINLHIDKQERSQFILEIYGKMPNDKLIEATRILEKRLGNEQMNRCIEAIEQNQKDVWIDIVLDYYDKSYQHSHDQRLIQNTTNLDANGLTIAQIAERLCNSHLQKPENY